MADWNETVELYVCPECGVDGRLSLDCFPCNEHDEPVDAVKRMFIPVEKGNALRVELARLGRVSEAANQRANRLERERDEAIAQNKGETIEEES